MINEIAQFP